jgi:hypothetical protein
MVDESPNELYFIGTINEISFICVGHPQRICLGWWQTKLDWDQFVATNLRKAQLQI